MKKCPYCAEMIQDEAIVCRFCKRDIPETLVSVEVDTTEKSEGITEKGKKPRARIEVFLLLGVVFAVLCLLCVLVFPRIDSNNLTIADANLPTHTLNDIDTIRLNIGSRGEKSSVLLFVVDKNITTDEVNKLTNAYKNKYQHYVLIMHFHCDSKYADYSYFRGLENATFSHDEYYRYVKYVYYWKESTIGELNGPANPYWETSGSACR